MRKIDRFAHLTGLSLIFFGGLQAEEEFSKKSSCKGRIEGGYLSMVLKAV